jgi:hypothetical protein
MKQTSVPSYEFLRCKALYGVWHSLVTADWPRDAEGNAAHERQVETALEEYYAALDTLIALKPSQQKLTELLSLAVMESKNDHLDGEECDLLSADQVLRASLQTFEALGEAANA